MGAELIGSLAAWHAVAARGQGRERANRQSSAASVSALK
jgi:hypothetical protein